MKKIKDELQENSDQSAIINKDAEFENRLVDPGFVFDDTQENSSGIDSDDQDIPKNQDDAEQDEQGTERAAPGLGELDGTNPGSNHHPMD